LSVAAALAYLESQHVVHRDVAARNVLVGADFACKLANFTLLRDWPALTTWTPSWLKSRFGEVEVDGDSATLLAPVSGGAADLTTALRELDDRAVAVRDVGLRRPTLDDVFLTLTGQPKPTSEDT
jgi:serine/threonine protein kinase